MNNKDLQQIFTNGENEAVEFKASFNMGVIESLSAFSNSKGGTVFVGVTDAGKICGVALAAESIPQWCNEIKSKTEPVLLPDVDIYEVEDKKIVAFSIQEYPVKPISLQGKFYKRIAHSNHLMNSAEISDCYMQTMQYSWDSYLYKDATFEDLNLEKVTNFIEKVNQEKRFKLPLNPKDALTKLNLLQGDKATNAAMVLFSKRNLLYNVHIGRFKTPSLIIADNMVNGNLFDVVEESMRIIISHLKFAFEINIKDANTQRTEIPEYPLDAVRELLLNSIIHRNYQSPTDIQIKIFDNKISFFNPTGLYGDITVEDLQTDSYRASTRNKLIAEAFYLTKDIEKYCSGFTRIRSMIADYPTMKFEYRNADYGFFAEFSYTEQKISTQKNVTDNVTEKVTERVTERVTDKVTENQQKILIEIEKNPYISQAKLSVLIGISRIHINKNISLLKSKGILTRIGPDRGGYWQINKQKEEHDE
ncbi:MAG: putative DNA binding domain-containing protein [Bacteroidales bacterium]|nr:putative DNA binding domain-containing protein [Bacteroidales bacterium]MDD4634604.1 putative DNA binding domain-containing protein [Bacteroidales bacterium]